MRVSVALLTAALATGLLVACSNGYGVSQTPSLSANDSARTTFIKGGLIPHGAPASIAPVELQSSSILARIHAAAGLGRPDAVKPGIYASVGYGSSSHTGSVNAYPDPNRSNGPPACGVVGRFIYPVGIAVDSRGDLIVPDGSADTITVYAGPRLCGRELGSVTVSVGPLQNVASLNAANGEILAANRFGPGKYGSVSVCTLSGGCTTNLKTPHMNAYGVALAPNGDCWASGGATLAYFAHCRGHAVIATGFQNSGPGGLDIDDTGNLVAISSASLYRGSSQLYVYSGCNPQCKLVGGPFQLKGGAFGHLDASSKHLVVADTENKELDVYSYSTRGIKYEYSISNGLPPSANVTGAAFSPPSKE